MIARAMAEGIHGIARSREGAHMIGRSRAPYIILTLLLLAALAHGLWVVRSLGMYTAILDTYRDAGFVQGIVDGNLSGDPSIEGAKRYYPPLIHAVAAAAAHITHMQPLPLLIMAAPWVNLLIPLTFFLMARRLTDASSAAIATALLVCFNGLLLPPWMAAAYTPWNSVPALTQALFYCTVWLISARVQQARFLDALFIGSAVGLVFLAHTVPALILAVITAAAAVTAQGLRIRTILWVATVGAVAALWAAPFLIPLITTYHLKIVNAAGSFTDPLFDPTHFPRRALLAILPGVAALMLLGWNFRASRTTHPLRATTVAMLSAWIILPFIFIARHYGCGGGGESAVCKAFQVPVHHWVIYLQSALTCLFGYAVVSLVGTSERRIGLPAIATVAAAAFVLFVQPVDKQMRDRALDMSNRIDLDLYEWLLASTQPDALFLTDISTDAVHDTAAMSVLAAGRRSVALPFTFSNPYIDWQARKAEAEADLAAARSRDGRSTLCQLSAAAGAGKAVYIALAPQGTVSDYLKLAFRSKLNDIYTVAPSLCD